MEGELDAFELPQAILLRERGPDGEEGGRCVLKLVLGTLGDGEIELWLLDGNELQKE